MKKRDIRNFSVTLGIFLLFVVYTLALTFIDVKPIGPNDSSVGFATVNGAVHKLLGVNRTIYKAGDYLSVIAAAIVLGFAVLGLYQLIKRKSLWKVDLSILTLGGFYAVVLIAYLLFEKVIVNYRPEMVENVMEASYPSSTTMLVLCVMGTAMIQFKRLIQGEKVLSIVLWASRIYMIGMVVCRLLSGVHWLTDIIGGILLSMTLIMLYCTVTKWLSNKFKDKLAE